MLTLFFIEQHLLLMLLFSSAEVHQIVLFQVNIALWERPAVAKYRQQALGNNTAHTRIPTKEKPESKDRETCQERSSLLGRRCLQGSREASTTSRIQA